ncbi:MAG: AAA family ATPase, partial [Xanthomonadales bacterium]|nr:AAA family ATPase [Xanthomonadales bacterium]
GETTGVQQLHPHQARFQLLEAVRSLLARAAAGHPFLLVLDDLHAADRESLLLLQHVCQHAAQSGYLVLGTFRELEARLADESSPLWRCVREALLLPLHGLGEQAVGALLEQRRGGPPDIGRVRQMLAATEGNPLYLQELLALPGQRTGGPDALPGLPGSLQQVIRQHLETLPEDTFDTLARAAVLGREFESAALAELLQQDENTVIAALQPAVQANLLRPAGESAWRFGHLFHREVLYACLDLGERQALHRRRAAALERAMKSGLDDAWAELAEHWLAAGPAHRRQAVAAWRGAAQRAGERLAYTESAVLFQRALETFGAGPGAEPAERFELLLQTACAALRAGDTDPGHALCLDAWRLARTLEDRVRMARAALAYGSTFTIGAVDPELVRLLRESLAALGRRRGPGANEDWNQLRPRLQARLAAALQSAADPSEPV